MQDELKPCPFCGSQVEIDDSGCAWDDEPEDNRYEVWCRDCCETFFAGMQTHEALLEAWNKRT